MTDAATLLREAQERRKRIALGEPAVVEAEEQGLSIALAETGKPGTNFKQVTPGARKKLSGLMKFYAKKPHPFAACVKDNTKRFGPERAKKVCAVLKDLIKNTTKWRKGGKAHASEKGADRRHSDDRFLNMTEAEAHALFLDDEVVDILEAMTPTGVDNLAHALAEDLDAEDG
jgi:hypothetical protein